MQLSDDLKSKIPVHDGETESLISVGSSNFKISFVIKGVDGINTSL